MSKGWRRLSPVLLLLRTSLCLDSAPALEVRVYDTAALQPKFLAQSISRLEAILLAAGASADVTLCIQEATAPCQRKFQTSRVLQLWIVPNSASKMNDARRPPLGQSVISETGYSIIFLPAVQREASTSGVPWPILLAYVAAHEIGHQLLGSNAHTIAGLMKGNWYLEDFQAMPENRLQFSGKQKRLITSCCGTLRRKQARGIASSIP
jgi:hypothetical protein